MKMIFMYADLVLSASCAIINCIPKVLNISDETRAIFNAALLIYVLLRVAVMLFGRRKQG